MKTGAHLQQAADASLDLDRAAGGCCNLAENLEQCAFAGAVAPDDTQHLALFHGERNIVQREDTFALPVAVICLPDLQIGVRLAAHACPPAVQVAADRACANHAQVITFGEMFNGNNCFAHNSFLPLRR